MLWLSKNKGKKSTMFNTIIRKNFSEFYANFKNMYNLKGKFAQNRFTFALYFLFNKFKTCIKLMQFFCFLISYSTQVL